MKDLERLLSTSLASKADRFEPRDLSAAREHFVARRRTRNRMFVASVAVAGAAVLAGAALAQNLVLDNASPGPGPTGEAPPPPGPPPMIQPVDPHHVLFVYSANGDLWAVLANGGAAQLTGDPDADVHPTISPDGTTVVFERRRTHPEPAPPALVELDLGSGDARVLGEGSWPTFGPDGRLAWVGTQSFGVGPEGGWEVATVFVGAPSAPLAADGGYGAASHVDAVVRHPVWIDDGSLAWETITPTPRGTDIHAISAIDLGRGDPERGAEDVMQDRFGWTRFLAPSRMRSPSDIAVVRICCGNARTERGNLWADSELEVGTVSRSEPGVYKSSVAIDPRLIDGDSSQFFLAPAGSLALEDGKLGVAETNDHRWLVSDGRSLVLVGTSNANDTSEGFSVFLNDALGRLDDPDIGGIAVSPNLLTLDR